MDLLLFCLVVVVCLVLGFVFGFCCLCVCVWFVGLWCCLGFFLLLFWVFFNKTTCDAGREQWNRDTFLRYPCCWTISSSSFKCPSSFWYWMLCNLGLSYFSSVLFCIYLSSFQSLPLNFYHVIFSYWVLGLYLWALHFVVLKKLHLYDDMSHKSRDCNYFISLCTVFL